MWTRQKSTRGGEGGGGRGVCFQAEDGIRDRLVTGVQTCALPIFGEIDGKVADSEARDKITAQTMLEKSLQLTIQRVTEESRSGKAPGATTSIFKLVGSTVAKEGSALKSELRGLAGAGWEGDGFTQTEVDSTRSWLRDRAVTIYGGTNEVQMNIIGKRVLGLPD